MLRLKYYYYCLIIILANPLLGACTALTNDNYVREVSQQGLQRHVIQAGIFPLVYYSRPNEKKAQTLHVYIGGDGIPWQQTIFISKDPGPYDPLVLRLMLQDKNHSIYLGRPCYQELARLPPCQSDYWTSGRYSDEVVKSMASALRQILHQYDYKQLAIFGYSGGGTLAVLLAHQVSQTRLVVTIAANLDTDAWTDYHYYSTLSLSNNPARLPALSSGVRQIHLQGDSDSNIPPHLSASYIRKQNDVTILSFSGTDHSCCWLSYWTGFLSILD